MLDNVCCGFTSVRRKTKQAADGPNPGGLVHRRPARAARDRTSQVGPRGEVESRTEQFVVRRGEEEEVSIIDDSVVVEIGEAT